MKTLSIAAVLLFAFGTITFAQDASSTTKTSTSKPVIHKQVNKGYPKMPKVPQKPTFGKTTPPAR